MNTTQIGDITEQKFILFCLEHNIPICTPVNNNLPYDCIIEIKDRLLKVQIKTGYKCKSKETFMFNTRSCSKNYTEITSSDYNDKIDYFVVWYKDVPNKFFIVPIEGVATGNMRIYYGRTPMASQNHSENYDFETFLTNMQN